MKAQRDVPLRGILRGLLAAGVVLGFAGVLWAHAVVVPASSATRAYETYTLRVPNEKDIPTTRVEITFPTDLFVVSFAEVPGWTLEVRRDDTGRAVGASWRGELPAGRFVELPFVGVNPAEPSILVWAVDQVYADANGEEVVSWSGPADSEFPASRTTVEAPDSAAGADGDGRDARREGGLPDDTLAVVAVFLSMVALVVAIASRRGRADSPGSTRSA